MEIEKLLELIEKGKCLLLTGARQPTRFFYKLGESSYHIDTFRGYSLCPLYDGYKPCATYDFKDFLLEVEHLRDIIENGKIEIRGK